MAIEIELKLSVAPGKLRQVARLPWLRRLVNGPIGREKLAAIYFDTPGHKLRESGLSLRIRNKGGKHVQTIKASNGAAGASARHEWESEVSSTKPDLKHAKNTALSRLADKNLKKKLRPVFSTEVQRITMPLRVRGSRVELAFDRGLIRTGTRRTGISEIELELKEGDRAELARLAARLAKTLPVAYGALAKSDRGYALSAGEVGKPVGANTIALDPATSTADAFAAIGSSCLNHLAANEQAVRAGESEGVHQMRVGLRRLRAAMSLFGDVVRNAQTERIKAELKWLSGELGPARDLDVLVEESVAPLRRSGPAKREMKTLERDLTRKRDSGFEKAKAAVASARYRNAILGTALWLIDGQWLRGKNPRAVALRERPILEFAQEVLRKRTRKIIKLSKALNELTPREWHKLRIAVKKLRYGTDFFASLFGNKARKAHKRFASELETLQSALGKLNDIAVHEKLAQRYAHPSKRGSKRPEKAFAMGVLTGQEQPRARACLAAAIEAGKALAKADDAIGR